VITFNIDEYYPISSQSIHSYRQYMEKHLFGEIDILPENIHIPDGTINLEDVHDYCRWYEKKIVEVGGIDLLLLGIGQTGHIGFNEPGSGRNSKTRIITLDTITRQEEAKEFQGFPNVPRKAITMGIDTILNAKRIILTALGETKAKVIQQTVEEEPTSEVPASFIQLHHNASVYLDLGASSQLVRVRTPWLLDSLDWSDDRLVRKAVIWLCGLAKKPILKLTGKDYNDFGLSDLLATVGSQYLINIKVFNDIQHTITGWPGGKPGVDDTFRPERANPGRKRVVIFSPHPDDDVISMGGTLLRLVEQGHDVHVAYQVSGNFAVSDEYVLRFLDFHQEYINYYDPENKFAQEQQDKVISFLKNKEENQSDKPQQKFSYKTLFSGKLGFATPLIWLFFIANATALYFLISWFPVVFMNSGFSPAQASSTTALFSVGSMVGGVFVGCMLDKYDLRIATIFPALGTIAVAILGFVSGAPLIVLVFMIGFFVVGTQYVLNGWTPLFYPTSCRTRATGVAIALAKFGSIAGPLIGGVLLNMHMPMKELFYIVAIPMFAGTLFCLALTQLYEKHFKVSDQSSTAAKM
jgi:glucosamine-6-phosphate isomerase